MLGFFPTLYPGELLYSAEVVGFPRHRQDIAALRQELPGDVYLWINAVKKELPNMSQADLDFWRCWIEV